MSFINYSFSNMIHELVFVRCGLTSCSVRSYIFCKMNKISLFISPYILGKPCVRTINNFGISSQLYSRNATEYQTVLTPKRYISDDNESRQQILRVKLMDFPHIIVPRLFKSLRNMFLSFLIRAYFDDSFTMQGFLEGAAKAVNVVSSSISDGNLDALKDLVSDQAILEIQNNYASLSHHQRKWVKVIPENMHRKFIYEIGMMFDDKTEQRYVEITVVMFGCHTKNNNDDGKPSHQTDWMQFIQDINSKAENLFVCNYRFIRDFSKGVEDSWTINKLNHFLPLEE